MNLAASWRVSWSYSCARCRSRQLAGAGWIRQTVSRSSGAPPSHEHWLAPMKWAAIASRACSNGTRISLLLAPAAALVSTLWRAGGRACGILRRNLVASRPRVHRPVSFSAWLFLLITVARFAAQCFSPLTSVLITFLILGLLGWAAAARVLSTSADALRNSDFVLQARASGLHGPRLFLIHVLPNLKPVLYAQFLDFDSGLHPEPRPSWHPRFGRRRPLPSWEACCANWKVDVVSRRTVATGAVVLLIVVMTSFQMLLSKEEVTA